MTGSQPASALTSGQGVHVPRKSCVQDPAERALGTGVGLDEQPRIAPKL